MRLSLSRRTDLALKALARLASAEGQTLLGRQLSDDLGTTHHYLPQVMKPLVSLNYVSSSPGPKGGYKLEANLATTTLIEVIEGIEGPFDIDRCVSTGELCPAVESCALHIPWTRAKHAVLAELGSVTLEVIGPDSESGG